ncbi:DUF4258 domain-containing protein [Sphingomonas profundi]|uniref:DUF4258 domain-containing protein n=1 Tax=Alterirhizorhabdus profundi TaxID=2681549 RepID=UPI001E658D74|nr:DUF4258 domain-containing protein [Sphingomonas profundi]
MMGAVEIRSGSGHVLVGPPGLFPGVLRAHRRRYAAMQALFADPRAVTKLRWYWPRLGLGGEPRVASDTELRHAFEQALAHNRLVALYVPHAATAALPATLTTARVAPRPPGAGARGPVSGWSRAERIEEALRRSAAHVGPELRALLDQLLSARTVALMVAFCVAIVLAQLGGVSAAAIDAALLAIAYACAGFAGIQAVYEFIAAAVAAAEARDEAALDAAAKRFAHAFVKLGEAFLAWLLARLQAKKIGGQRTADGGGSGGPSAAGERPANAMVGRRSPGLENSSRQLKFPEGVPRNARGYVNGREFSGHAFDRMQERGLVPSAIEDAIRHGVPTPSGPNATVYHSAANGVTAIVDNVTGRVITVY